MSKKGGIYIGRKRIKLKGKNYFISVYTYYNNRIRLKYETNKESHDITLDLKDTYLDNANKVFLDPFIMSNGLYKQLKKTRIIREICGSTNYNYVEVPIAILNLGILRQYDANGLKKHVEKVHSNG